MRRLPGDQEFKVLGATFPAEFGRSLGSVINVAYKSGSNNFHGSGYEFLRDSALDSKNYFQKLRGETPGDFSRHQFGGSAGGPLQIGKMFYMASFEGLREKAFASTHADGADARSSGRGTFRRRWPRTGSSSGSSIRSAPAPIPRAASSATSSPTIRSRRT